MIIALFATADLAISITEGLEARGHACILSTDSIPGEADCLVVVGDAGKKIGRAHV